MEDSQSDTNIFNVRIVSIDYYMAPPIPDIDICYSSFQGGKVNEVPVIRIYGATPAGQKTCLHIHRALPYLYVPCADLLLQPHQEDHIGDAYRHVISHAIEKALKLRGNVGSRRQHVHGCSLVRAKKFYGYHSSEELFVKIYLYYPHDVSRAANLLMGGAILDKSLQPHESHIPYLLQFLVDYNLYGMGHVHLSRMKFRHPVPDVFSPRKDNYDRQHRQETDNISCTPANFQADSSGDACLRPPVWISSTIPAGWMWQFPGEYDTPSDQDINLVKRQSICELEGDATIDDILNQQFKMYSSLSQTCSNVKMVQSLVPIWEEEYERTGMHEEVIHPDPGKPLPENVLKTLLQGFTFENKLVELCSEVEYSLSLTPLEKVQLPTFSGNEGNAVEVGHAANDNYVEPLKCLEERKRLESMSSQGSQSQKDHDAIDSVEYPKKVPVDEMHTSELIETLDPKAADKETLGLLKWLASSQAAEDLNSDDELVCETILSPFLPATTIDKMLERANMDYENGSQQECRDILDSVESSIDYEGIKERASCSHHNNHSPQTSSEKMIPQMDGSGDDQYLTPPVGNTGGLDRSSEFIRSPQPQAQKDNGTSFTSKHKRNKTLWGSLPFSASQKGGGDLQPVSFKRHSEAEYDKISSTMLGNEEENCSDVPMNNADSDVRNLREGSTLVGCSVRDLMRRKRSYHVEPPECESHRVKRVQSVGEQNADRFICSKQLNFHTLQNEGHDIKPLHSSKLKPLPTDQQTVFHEACDVNSTGSSSSMHGELPLVFSMDVSLQANTLNGGHSISSRSLNDMAVLGVNVGSDNLTNTYPSQVHMGKEEFPVTLNSRLTQVDVAGSSILSCSTRREMFYKGGHRSRTSMEKVPELIYGNFEGMEARTDTKVLQFGYSGRGGQRRDTDFSGPGESVCTVSNMEAEMVELIGMTFCKKPPIADWTNMKSENLLLSSPTLTSPPTLRGEGTTSDEFLPFFIEDCQEEKELRNKCCENDALDFHHEAVMGVPTHYQNDGSYLYLLTPVFSPPSADCVHEWLYHDEKGSCSGLIDSQGSLADACKKPFPASSFGSNQQDHGNLNAEMDSVCNVVAILPQSEGNIINIKECTNSSQDISQISGPDGKSKSTPVSQSGFRDPASVGGGQQLTLFSIEVFTESRGDLRPDPRFDAVNVIALVIQEDDDSVPIVYVILRCCDGPYQRNLDGISGCNFLVCSEEKHLYNHFMKIICSFDPDILMGWDVQGGSLGFLAERASYLGIGLLNIISRTPSETKIVARDFEIPEKGLSEDLLPETVIADRALVEDAIIEDEWGRTHASGVHVGGRVVLNIWRLMRGEIKLNMYTVEAVAEAVLRRKIPSIHYKVLTKWFFSGPGRARYRCIEYVIERAKLNLEIMNQIDMINRTSELARVFGIDFFSVLSRGSQYRVESMFLRLAHSQNYLAISPGSQQVASQPAMECLPLVLEPESGFYADPVVVLDFQSLYPSMIIGYNLCFCTCLGKVSPSKPNTLGVSFFSPDPHVLRDVEHQILLTPNGVMYVPSKVRKGVLPRLLEEILSTRIMVKQAMKKLHPSQKILQRIFNARQLALKLIANVTYGYTAAGFSGRMPCAELADSIVQCGRRTLENAISFVNAHDKWKANVIYGDTDSMFVLLKGRTVKESFQIGQEIASAITALNPNPVTLKMEKVYSPCFLLTKKRYVGYSYESPDQTEPVFDAKGIETVRRDTCAAVSKTMEQSLRLFFEHQDIYKVKSYLQRQWKRILSGRVSLQDFVFAKEVRLGTYSTRVPQSLPPAAIVATKAMRADPRAEPRYGERVPYVVIHGEPGARLIDMVVDPLDLLAIDSPFRLNDLYYINKQIIPALQRVFGLVGADLNQWFLEMPRPVRNVFGKHQYHAPNSHRARIDYYYLSKHCILCGELVQASAHLCNACSKKGNTVVTAVTGKTSKLEREMHHLAAMCRHCGGGDWVIESGIKCTSLACSVFFERRKVQKELQALSAVATEAGMYPRCMVEWF